MTQTQDRFDIKWSDYHREPTQPSNPEYPNGIDLVVHDPRSVALVCKVNLPYPAKRCGLYTVSCNVCHKKFAVTTAGRADDPASLTISCPYGSIPQVNISTAKQV
jgi:hypothetical protein